MRLSAKKRQQLIVEKLLKEGIVNDHKFISFRQYPFAEEWGLKVIRYWDEPGLYTLNRLQCENEGLFCRSALPSIPVSKEKAH